MAKRKSRRSGKAKRSFRGFGALPSLSTYNASVKGLDVLAGVGVGFLGVIAVKYIRYKLEGMKTTDPTTKVESDSATAKYFKDLPNWAKSLTPAIGGILGGVAAYAVSKKFMGGGRGAGHLIGAAFTGLALSADVLIRDNLGKDSGTPKTTVDGKEVPEKKALMPFYNGIEDYAALVPDSTFGALRSDFGALQADYGRYGALRSDYAGYEGRNEIEQALGY